MAQCSVIESMLMKHPDIWDCAAFAGQCQNHTEAPAAWVVLKPGVVKNDVIITFEHLLTSLNRKAGGSEIL